MDKSSLDPRSPLQRPLLSHETPWSLNGKLQLTNGDTTSRRPLGWYVSWSSFCAKNKTKTSKYRHGNADSFRKGNPRLSFSLLFFIFSLKQTHLLTQMFFRSSLTRIAPLHRLIRLLPHAELLLPSTILRTVNADGVCLLEYAVPVCRCTYRVLHVFVEDRQQANWGRAKMGLAEKKEWQTQSKEMAEV